MSPNMLLKALTGLMIASVASAHMELSWPYPLRSKLDPNADEGKVDYSMTNPLASDGKNFPCKGYHTDTPFRSTVEWSAGQKYNISLKGSATHGGGSCQLALSYDNGTSFHAIQSMEGGCPLEDTYDFTLPEDAPAGDALFAWTWFNLQGNREMYMNCADVTIQGGSGSPDDFEKAYPTMFAANVGNGCETVEGKPVVFADPGKQVVFGEGVSEGSEVSPACS
ncbi:uncharacterized protein TRUGW13939_01565 [Talaromyces rugulosus]|uniref:Chitin-binding type-4 domain-containing protein n=1 Tax=Talaromyces rugulosus TaxID=121627 RepID=A0A7H8QKR7_TALRU|nr:uncharacterized protein TRUGW13939_01565 [Talaromyces rugulosus]QKX54478.1 hypothetical protein TRUGW13939_01565 [Talaromyces rugulosus]